MRARVNNAERFIAGRGGQHPTAELLGDQSLKRRHRIGVIVDDQDDVATKWLFWGHVVSLPLATYLILQACRPTPLRHWSGHQPADRWRR